MKLKVLGSSSKGNCYLLESDKETLIIEAGIGIKDIKKGLNYDFKKVVGCLVTHEHKDHSKSITELFKSGIDVYASKGTFGEENHHRAKIIKAMDRFKVGEFTIMAFDTEHDCSEPLGFLVDHKDMGRLLFLTDSYFLKYKFQHISHIMIECNYSLEILNDNIERGYVTPSMKQRLLKSHFSLENVIEFIKCNSLSIVNNIVLLHLSDGNCNAELFQKTIEQLTDIPTSIADKGLEMELSYCPF